MQEDFLNSQGWLSLVFEGRNKEYGAYVHRKESSDRHLIAMAIITVVALGLIFIPKVIKSVLPATDNVRQTATVNPIWIEPQNNAVRTPNKVDVPPPTLGDKVKDLTKFTNPLVTADENVANGDLPPTQQTLTATDAAISSVTVQGVPGGAVVEGPSSIGTIVEEPPKKPFEYVEIMPQFPGGNVALMKWLQDNMTYPVDAQAQNIQGRVTLRFVVKPDGSIDDVQVVKGLNPSCDKEAVRVLKKMPKWIPGRQNGNAVSVYYSLPVVFRLQNN